MISSLRSSDRPSRTGFEVFFVLGFLGLELFCGALLRTAFLRSWFFGDVEPEDVFLALPVLLALDFVLFFLAIILAAYAPFSTNLN